MAAAQDPVEETRRLIGLGNEQILRVAAENFDTLAQDAWPAFRRGVVRAEGCREVPAEELLGAVEGKAQVLAFLADFAERKRGYRRQVETVLRILLKGPQWLEAARGDPALCARLPGAEVSEMLSAAAADAAASVPAAQARAERASLAAAVAPQQPAGGGDAARSDDRKRIIADLQASFKELDAMGSAASLDGAAASAEKFSLCVAELLRRKVDADIAEIEKLEPKGNTLQLLCVLHEKRRSSRSLVNNLLFSLMETPSLASWRATVDGNPDLRAELEGLGILDHNYRSFELGAAAGDGAAGDGASGDEQSGAAETYSVGSGSERRATWMWRDAGGGGLFHKLATLNPVRWSPPATIEETIADLEQYLDTPQGERPVKVRVFGGGLEQTNNKSSTVAGAVSALRMLLRRP